VAAAPDGVSGVTTDLAAADCGYADCVHSLAVVALRCPLTSVQTMSIFHLNGDRRQELRANHVLSQFARVLRVVNRRLRSAFRAC
jgi:hypothetical protein